MVPRCPQCGVELEEEIIHDRMGYHCRFCDGWLLTLGTLRARCAGETGRVSMIWQMAREVPKAMGWACPLCGDTMKRVFVPLTETGAGMELDVCVKSGCQVIWFDVGELAEMPESQDPAQIPAEELPPKAKEIMALHQVKMMARQQEIRDHIEAIGGRRSVPVSRSVGGMLIQAVMGLLMMSGDDDL